MDFITIKIAKNMIDIFRLNFIFQSSEKITDRNGMFETELIFIILQMECQ